MFLNIRVILIQFLLFAIFVIWSGFLFFAQDESLMFWMCQWFHSTIFIQNSKNSAITKKHAKSKWKSHSARGRVIEWMLNNCWVACPWNGMTYFVWFLRRFLLTYLLWFLSLRTIFTYQANQIEESSSSLLIIRWLCTTYYCIKCHWISQTKFYHRLTPHSQMIINIDCASKIHRIRSHSRAQKKLTMLAYMYVIYACILEWASMKESLKQVWKFNIQVVSMHHYTFFLMNYKRPCCVCFINVAS